MAIFSWYTIASWLLNDITFFKKISDINLIKFFFDSDEQRSYTINIIFILFDDLQLFVIKFLKTFSFFIKMYLYFPSCVIFSKNISAIISKYL